MKLLGLLVKLVGLVVLLAILGLAWLRFSDMRSQEVGEGDLPVTSEERAEIVAEAEARIEAARETGAESVALSEVELASLLREALEEELPGGIEATGVTLVEGEARLRGRVELALLPPMSWLDPLRNFLPDQVPVEIRCAVLAVEEGAAVLLIRGFSVAGIPVPRSTYSVFLPELGGRETGDLPPEAVRVLLPPGISAVRIDQDSVVIGVPR